MREYRARKKARAEAEAASLEPEPVPQVPVQVAEPELVAPRLTWLPGMRPGDSPAVQVAEWSRQQLRVPTGPLRGRPFELPPWQVEYLEGALQPGVREAGLSVARKNGKSGLVAAYILACLAGPLYRPDWRCVVASLTGGLAKELRDAVQLTAEASGIVLDVRRSPPPGEVARGGARATFLAADKATGHALGADLAVLDEAGLLAEKSRDLWNAMLSSVSGRDGRLFAISVQGEGPMFAGLETRSEDAAVYWRRYSAPEDAALDSREAWQAANPGLQSGIKSLAYMSDMARRALANPADQRSFRALDLNQAVDPSREVIVSPTDWTRCYAEEPPERGGPCYVGVDLGGAAAMSAGVAYWPETGRLEALAAYGSEPDLRTRGDTDGVGSRYEQMRDRGELLVLPGRVTPAELFLSELAERLDGEPVQVLGMDRYRRHEAEAALAAAAVRWPVSWRGTGASAKADGSHDVRAFQRAVLEERIRTRPSLLLESAIADSALRFDQAGNPALDKARAHGRVDALQAAVIATGLAAASKPVRAPRVALV